MANLWLGNSLNKYRPIRRNGYLTKCMSGLLSTASSGALHTTHVQTVVECPYYYVRIGILNSVTASIANVKAAIGSSGTIGSKSTTAGHSASWTDLTFGGGATTSLASGTVALPTVTWSDWLRKTYTARSDGGTLPVLAVRVEIPAAAANIPIWGTNVITSTWDVDTTDSESVAPYGRTYRCRTQATDGVTTTANFTSTTFNGSCVPIIIQYQPITPGGFSVAAFGDSVVEGAGATVSRHGWDDHARALVSTQSFPIELCNLAASATAMTDSADKCAYFIPQVLPEFALTSTYSPNNIAPGTVTRANMDSLSSWAQAMRRTCFDNFVNPIMVTGMPTNPAVEDYDASDSERRDYNDRNRAAALKGQLLFDLDAIMAGSLDGDGQMQINASYTSDGLHPNTTGHEAAGASLANLFRRIVRGYAE